MTDETTAPKPRRRAPAKPRKPRAKPAEASVDVGQLPLPEPAQPKTKTTKPRVRKTKAPTPSTAPTATAQPRRATVREQPAEPELRIDVKQIWRVVRPHLTPSRLTLLILLLTAAAFTGVLLQAR